MQNASSVGTDKIRTILFKAINGTILLVAPLFFFAIVLVFIYIYIYFYWEPETDTCNMQDIESSTAAMNSLQGTVLASSDNDGLHIEYPQYNACFYCNNSVSYLYIYVNTHNLSHGARQFLFSGSGFQWVCWFGIACLFILFTFWVSKAF
jgi:hypothetical protein